MTGTGDTRPRGLLRSHPLSIAVLGFAGGFLAGALLPPTRPEDRVLGPLRDDAAARGLRKGEALARDLRAAAERDAPAGEATGTDA